jgi:Fe-S cluster assembly protein SufD
VRDGVLLDIADGAELEAPIELQNVQAGRPEPSALPATFGKGAKATVIERHVAKALHAASSVGQLISLGEGAESPG